jgi:hypothetical protein
MIRFLKGTYFVVDAFAIQDFEAMPLGPIEELVGQITIGDCYFEHETYFSR